jgi:hypothetical protein
MRSAALAAYVAVLAAFTLFIGKPFLEKQREFPAEVPSPYPLAVQSLDVVRGGGRLCMTDVAISRQTEQMRFQIGTYGRPGPPLQVSVRAPGYRAAVRVGAGWADNLVHHVPLPRPAGDQLVTVCIQNGGRRKIAVYAAGDNARSRVGVFIDGQRVFDTPQLAFYERGHASIAQRASLTADRLATFRGLFGHEWIVWVLAFLFAAGMPVLLGAALWTSLGRH